MSKIKVAVAGLVLGAGMVSGQALAATTGTVAATSEYMFRGIESSQGAAIQGSLTYNHGNGLYVGGWASNTAPVTTHATNELDVYAGYAMDLSNGIKLDLGAIYYAYTEDEETPTGVDADYPELFVGLSFGGLSGKVFYADEFLGDAGDAKASAAGLDTEAIYVTLSYALAVREGVDLTFQVGHSSGDGVEAVLGDEVLDYSVALSKNVGNGMSANFAVVGTDLESATFEDEPKVVVSFSKNFDL